MFNSSSSGATGLALAAALFFAPVAHAGFFDQLKASAASAASGGGAAGGSAPRSNAKVVKNDPGLWRGTWDSKKFPHHIGPYIQTAVSTAEIERNGARIKIDFSKPEDVAKLKDGDMVFLEPGLYTYVPTQAAANLTFVGVEGKTSIGNYNARRISLPTRGTRFWDVVIDNSSFQTDSGRIFLVNSRLKNWNQATRWGANPVYNTEVVAVFSNMDLAGGSLEIPLTSQIRFTNSNNVIRPYALFLSYGMRSDDKKKFIDVDTSPEFSAAYPEAAPIVTKLQERLGASLNGGAPFLTPELAGELYASRNALLNAARDGDRRDKQGARYATLQQETVDETLRYLKWKTKWSPAVDAAQVDAWLAKASAELKAGNAVLALALTNRALSSMGASEYAPALELQKRAGEAVGKRYGCTLKGDGTILNVRNWALKNMPLLAITTPGADCTITFQRTAPAEPKSEESVTASVVETRLEEFDPMARYKQMMAAAAAKEAEKAFMAGINASTERMKDTARKMYDYRVRREGDFLVYGQGNFAGQASAGTLSAQSQAQANAQAYAQAAQSAQARGMQVRQVQERTDTYYINITQFEGVSATIEKKGEPGRRITPPIESETGSIGPCQRKKHSDLEVHMARGECFTNGPRQGRRGGASLYDRYYNTYVWPFLATFVAESMVPPVLVKVGEAQKSARPGTQLEAKLLAHFANLTPAADADIAALAEKVTGEKLSLQQFSDELGLN